MQSNLTNYKSAEHYTKLQNTKTPNDSVVVRGSGSVSLNMSSIKPLAAEMQLGFFKKSWAIIMKVVKTFSLRLQFKSNSKWILILSIVLNFLKDI